MTRLPNEIAETGGYNDGFNGRLIRYHHRAILEALAGVAPGRAVEVGVGEQANTALLSAMFGEVIGIEPAAEYAEALRSDGAIRVIESTMEGADLDEYAGTVDAVLMCCVLEHVLDPARCLEKARSLLHHDGVLVVIVPNATSLHRRVGRHMGLIGRLDELGDGDRRLGHLRYYDFDMLEDALSTAGFGRIDVDGLLLKPLPNSMMDLLPVELVDGFYDEGRYCPRDCCEIVAVARP